MSEIYSNNNDIKLEIGSHHTVIIDKLYGPLAACQLKIIIDSSTRDWVILREVIPLNGESTWEEMARFGVQDSIEYDPLTD